MKAELAEREAQKQRTPRSTGLATPRGPYEDPTTPRETPRATPRATFKRDPLKVLRAERFRAKNKGNRAMQI